MCASMMYKKDDTTLTSLTFRSATSNDLPHVVRMLAADDLGHQRENYTDPLPQSYYDAFAAIDASPLNELIVVEADDPQADSTIIGTLQLTFIPNIAFQGGTRALIEGVRVDQQFRGQGIGQQLFEWAIERARTAGCHMVQLTMNKQRADAFRFYERLGFTASHEGFKRYLH